MENAFVSSSTLFMKRVDSSASSSSICSKRAWVAQRAHAGELRVAQRPEHDALLGAVEPPTPDPS